MADANGRFYDPQFGVFLSPDPVSPLGGSSPRMNRYAYVGYDPVNFTDPSGYILAPLLFSLPALGTLATIAGTIGSINFLSTGEFKLTWDENTTEGAVTLLVASAAGAGCGVAGGPLLAGLCAGFAGGATAASFAPRPDFGSILTGAVAGTIIGGVGSAVGVAAGAGALSLTQNHLAMTFASAAASSGTGVGIQLALGSEVNWTIVAAQGVISGALAFHRAAELDAAAQRTGQASGIAAGSASRSAAGLTRSVLDLENTVYQTEFSRAAGAIVFLRAGDPPSGPGSNLTWDPRGHTYRLSGAARARLDPVFRHFGFSLDRPSIAFGGDISTNGSQAFTVGDSVIINRNVWENLTTLQQQQLLAHEITHSIQYDKLGIAGFLARYAPEFIRPDNYAVPTSLLNTPLSSLDIVDADYTLDQIAERVRLEVR